MCHITICTVLRLQPVYIKEIKFPFSSFEIDKTIKTDAIPDTSQGVRHVDSYAKDGILNRRLLLSEDEIFVYVELLVVPAEPELTEKPSVMIQCSTQLQLYSPSTINAPSLAHPIFPGET